MVDGIKCWLASMIDVILELHLELSSHASSRCSAGCRRPPFASTLITGPKGFLEHRVCAIRAVGGAARPVVRCGERERQALVTLTLTLT